MALQKLHKVAYVAHNNFLALALRAFCSILNAGIGNQTEAPTLGAAFVYNYFSKNESEYSICSILILIFDIKKLTTVIFSKLDNILLISIF